MTNYHKDGTLEMLNTFENGIFNKSEHYDQDEQWN